MDNQELKQARQKLGLTHKAMAKILGTKLRTWEDWVYGKTPVPGPVGVLIKMILAKKIKRKDGIIALERIQSK